MKVVKCSQLSDEWYELHRGRPTASKFDRILSPVKRAPSASQTKLICELIAQKFSFEPMKPTDQYVSPDMMRGVVNEPEARRWYCMTAGVDVAEVGFCMTDDDRFGCSPDGLIGDEGGLELKAPRLETQAAYLLKGKLPDEYKCQVHGCLIVTGRAWWDFCSYAPGLPGFMVRVTPDDFTEALRAELDRFWEKYQAALAKMRAA